MNKEQARKRIKDTFEKAFSKRRFTSFVKDLLNTIGGNSFTYRGQYIKEAYREHIQSLDRIGKFSDGKNNLDILIITLQKDTSLHRARTMQRNFVASYLNGSRNSMKDAALVAYVTPNRKEWRFSLVKMDYSFKESDGTTEIEKKITPARRWSFLVGENEKSHTAQSRLVNIFADDKRAPNLVELEEAFDIETVTNEFFRKYRDLFLRTKSALDDVLSESSKAKNDFEAKGVDTVNFAKKLLGQIAFLYFLQKKGWFGVGQGDEWGTGSKDFLRSLYNKKHCEYNNFFNDVLEPLFYEALRLDRTHNDNYFGQFKCKIPFLNGGLFDPIGNYDWEHTDIHLPDDLFYNNRKTKEGDSGDGILNVFDRYNFTVCEDEPLEKEVAIDPELLGKAYEKFNAIRPDNFHEFTEALKRGEENKFNKKLGVYYTPREIVHYMCKQSLINYLFAHAGGLSTKVDKQDIKDLIEIGELITEHEATALIKQEEIGKGTQKSTGYIALLPASIWKSAETIDRLLAEISVCDPAVGSGAFPVGMMNEIVRARMVLSVFVKTSRRSEYELKRHCIEHSLYGVDIDPGAVEIAKLRLWLSLIVAEEENNSIKPLPNLDYKIICGNALLGVKVDCFNDAHFRELKELKPRHISETDPDKKSDQKNRIEQLIGEILKDEEFDLRAYFSEVLLDSKAGFDVVIANPPYVRADSGPEHLAFRKKLMKSKMFKTLCGKWDLMIPFIEKGLHTFNNKGNLSYIVSDAVCTSKYACKLLELIQKDFYTYSIDYFENMAVFEAGVVPVVINIGKAKNDGINKKMIHNESFNKISSKSEMPVEKFNAAGIDAFRKEFSPIIPGVKTYSLGDILYISVGMVLHADEKTAKGQFVKDDLISDNREKDFSRPYVEGKDIGSFLIRRTRFLEWGTKRVPGQLRRATFPELYERPKIMKGRQTKGIYDDSGLVCNDSIVVCVRFVDLREVKSKSIQSSVTKNSRRERHELEQISMKFDLKYILSILNSSFATKYLNNIRRHRLKNYFYPGDFRKLPIADIPPEKQRPFIDIVDKILAITKDEDYLGSPKKMAVVKKFEEQIDRMVYDLYEFTKEQIRILQEAAKLDSDLA